MRSTRLILNLNSRTGKCFYHHNYYLKLQQDIIDKVNNTQKHIIIDARSPNEFKQDNIIGSINVPVLNNEDRVHVGTLYKRDKYQGRLVGAGLIAKNIGEWLLQNKEQLNAKKDHKFTVYCARGGQRSKSLAYVMKQIGFNVSTFDNGYKDYRKIVLDTLTNVLTKYNKIVLISGRTGVGKSNILNELRNSGEQVLDLEWAARHYGSILGEWPDIERPSHIMFQSHLYWQLKTFCPDPTKPVFVENEGSRIGEFSVPGSLLSNMYNPMIVIRISASIEERVKYIRKIYNHWELPKNREKLLIAMSKIFTRNIGNSEIAGKENRRYMLRLLEQGDFDGFVRELVTRHYDRKYDQKENKILVSKRIIDLHVDSLKVDDFGSITRQVREICHSHVLSCAQI
jgi:tRNA 2-selenouridine synthase